MKKFIITYYYGSQRFTIVQPHRSYSKAMYMAGKPLLKDFFDIEYPDGGLGRVFTKHVTHYTVNEIKKGTEYNEKNELNKIGQKQSKGDI